MSSAFPSSIYTRPSESGLRIRASATAAWLPQIFRCIYNPTTDYAQAVAVGSDGKIVVAGDAYSGSNSGYDFAVARYNLDGTLDTTFGNGGKLTLGSFNDVVGDVAVMDDGRVVVVGSGPGGFEVVRLTNNGQLDPTFNGTGIQTFDFGSNAGASSVALASDGSMVVAGSCDYGSDFAVARLTNTGQLDTCFNSTGMQIVNVGGSNENCDSRGPAGGR